MAVLLLAPAAAVADSHLSSDPDVGVARALLNAGRADDALKLLRKLDATHPAHGTDVLFLTGLAAISAAQMQEDPEQRNALLDEAIGSLRTILVNRPGLLRVRLELARAFFLKEDDDLAREHFERVLAGHPPGPVVANIRRFLRQIRARRRWSMHMGFALAPDTNISGKSSDRTIYIYGLPFRLDADSQPKSGVGVVFWGGGEYQHPLGDRLRLRMGADLSRREYETGKFDDMSVSAHAGPRVLATADTEFSVLGTWRQQWSANRRNYVDLGGSLSGRQRLNRQITLNGRGSLLKRRYRRTDYLDGPIRSVSLGAGWVVAPTVKLDGRVGHRYERPDSTKFRNEGKWLQGGVSVALPLGFTVGGSVALRWTSYKGEWFPHTPAGVRRKDRVQSLRASVYNRSITVYGFSPEAAIVHETRETNAQTLDYRRTGGELRFIRQF